MFISINFKLQLSKQQAYKLSLKLYKKRFQFNSINNLT